MLSCSPRASRFEAATDVLGVREGTLQVRLDRRGRRRHAAFMAISNHGCAWRAQGGAASSTRPTWASSARRAHSPSKQRRHEPPTTEPKSSGEVVPFQRHLIQQRQTLFEIGMGNSSNWTHAETAVRKRQLRQVAAIRPRLQAGRCVCVREETFKDRNIKFCSTQRVSGAERLRPSERAFEKLGGIAHLLCPVLFLLMA